MPIKTTIINMLNLKKIQTYKKINEKYRKEPKSISKDEKYSIYNEFLLNKDTAEKTSEMEEQQKLPKLIEKKDQKK